jgi:hypothetical protein
MDSVRRIILVILAFCLALEPAVAGVREAPMTRPVFLFTFHGPFEEQALSARLGQFPHEPRLDPGRFAAFLDRLTASLRGPQLVPSDGALAFAMPAAIPRAGRSTSPPRRPASATPPGPRAESTLPSSPSDAFRPYRNVHIIFVDDNLPLIESRRDHLVDGGFIDRDHAHLSASVEEGINRFQELKSAGIPDEEILVVADLAFHADPRELDRREPDGLDLVNWLRLSRAAGGLNFKGRILVHSGSVPLSLQLEELVSQGTTQGFGLAYRVKSGVNDFVEALYQTLVHPPAVEAEITQPLVASARWREMSLRYEFWADLDSLLECVRGIASDALGALPDSARTSSDEKKLQELETFAGTARERLDRNEYLHRLIRETSEYRPFVEQMARSAGSRAQVLLKDLANALGKVSEFSNEAQIMDRVIPEEGQPVQTVSIEEALRQSLRGGGLEGYLQYRSVDGATSRDPWEVLPAGLRENRQIPLAAAYAIRAVLKNSLEAYRERYPRDLLDLIAWESRPVEIGVHTVAENGVRKTILTLTDRAGGVRGFALFRRIFHPHAGTKRDHPGFGLYWAKFLARAAGFEFKIHSRGDRTQAVLIFEEKDVFQLAEDPNRRPPPYQPKNDVEHRLQEAAFDHGGKVEGWRRMAEASTETGIMVPSFVEMPNAQVWIPFLKANAALMEKGDAVVRHYAPLVDFILEQAGGVEDVSEFFERLAPLVEPLGLDGQRGARELFAPGFNMPMLRGEGGAISRRAVEDQLDDYLRRLSRRFILPENLAALSQARAVELKELIRQRGEEFDGTFVLRTADAVDATFAESHSPDLVSLPCTRDTVTRALLESLQTKASQSWRIHHSYLAEESYSPGLMNTVWVDAGIVAYTDIYDRLVVEITPGQPDTITSGQTQPLRFEFKMDETGKVSSYRVKQPYENFPKAIHVRDAGLLTPSDGEKYFEQFRRLTSTLRLQELVANRNYTASPLDEEQLLELARRLWKLQRHRKFGYPLKFEGGVRKDGYHVIGLQADPSVGLPESESGQDIPYKLPEAIERLDVPVCLGVGAAENIPVVILGEEASAEDLSRIDAQLREGYIVVARDAASRVAGMQLPNMKAVADPGGSGFAHNISLINRRIGEGLVYLAGYQMEKFFRTMNYDRPAPGIRISRSRVSAYADGLNARLFEFAAENPSGGNVRASIRPGLPTHPISESRNWEEAFAANGLPKCVAFHREGPREDVTNVEIESYQTIREAMGLAIKWGEQAVFISHTGYPHNDIFPILTDDAFKGIILDVSGGMIASLTIREFLKEHPEYKGRVYKFGHNGIQQCLEFLSEFNRKASAALIHEPAAEDAVVPDISDDLLHAVRRFLLKDFAGFRGLTKLWEDSYETERRQEFIEEAPRRFAPFLTEEDCAVLSVVVRELFHDMVGKPLDPTPVVISDGLRAFLSLLREEISLPYYPELVDSWGMRLLRRLCDAAFPSEAVSLRAASRTGVPIIIAADDFEAPLATARRMVDESAASLGVPFEFYDYISPDMAAHSMMDKDPFILITDVSFGGRERGVNILEAAMARARETGKPFHLIVASGVGEDSAEVRRLRGMAESLRAEGLMTFSYAGRNEADLARIVRDKLAEWKSQTDEPELPPAPPLVTPQEPTRPAGLPTQPYSADMTLEEAVQANGLPKKVVMIDTLYSDTTGKPRRHRGELFGWKSYTEVSLMRVSDNWRDQVYALGEKAILIVHGINAEYVASIIADPQFKGILVFESGGRSQQEAVERELGKLGKQYQGRWFCAHYDQAEMMIKSLGRYNKRAEAAQNAVSSVPGSPAAARVLTFPEALQRTPGRKHVALVGCALKSNKDALVNNGVQTIFAETFWSVLKQCAQWGEQAVLVVHGVYPKESAEILQRSDFKGILVFVSGGGDLLDQARTAFHDLGSEYAGRWFVTTGTREIDLALIEFNESAQEAEELQAHDKAGHGCRTSA